MWYLLEELVAIFIILLSITEFFIPLLLNKPFFGSFRKKKVIVKEEPKSEAKVCELKTKVAEAKEKVKEVKKVQDDVVSFYNEAQELKDESDDIMK